MAADDRAVRALDLAGAVGVHGQFPAHLVQDHVMVPPAVVLEVGEAGAAAVLPVQHMVRFAARRGLVASAGMLPQSTQDREQASWKTSSLRSITVADAAWSQYPL